MQYVWQWFLELNSGRQYSEIGALPLTFTEIKAWAELTENAITPLDVQVIKRLDHVALSNK